MYKRQAFANWPTTDPFDWEEQVSAYFRKFAKVDVEHIRSTEKFLSGQFASYHIYPYFPDYLGFQDVLGQEVPQKYRFMAVSYTHLDVYKRQPGSSCGI